MKRYASYIIGALMLLPATPAGAVTFEACFPFCGLGFKPSTPVVFTVNACDRDIFKNGKEVGAGWDNICSEGQVINQTVGTADLCANKIKITEEDGTDVTSDYSDLYCS